MRYSRRERRLNPCKPACGKTVVLTQLWRACWTIELKDRLTVADDMHMGRSMVIGVNHHAQTIYLVNRRHYSINPNVLVIFFIADESVDAIAFLQEPSKTLPLLCRALRRSSGRS